jgi:hypothetical protein
MHTLKPYCSITTCIWFILTGKPGENIIDMSHIYDAGRDKVLQMGRICVANLVKPLSIVGLEVPRITLQHQ